MNSEIMHGGSLYKKNFNNLKKISSDLCAQLEDHTGGDLNCRDLLSEKGVPTIEVTKGGSSVLLHSKRDPVDEARRLVEANISGGEQMVTVVGFGLGYHVEELLRKTADPVILIIEPSLTILKTALGTRDLSFILNSGRIMITTDTGFTNQEIVDLVPAHTNIKLLVLRPYAHLFPVELEKARDTFYSFLNRREINTATLKRFDRLWTKNTFKNISYFFSLHGINELSDILRGIPAIVICAGPSLDTDLEHLADYWEDCVIIAVDTTLKPLLKRGIKPDFAVTVDPQFINSFFMSSLGSYVSRGSDLPVLIADPAVYPSTLRNYTGPRVLTSSVFSPGKIIEGFSGDKGDIAAGGSVSVAAFDLARITGSDPIILLGLDFSYSGGKTHFSGSFMENYIMARIDRFKSAQTYYTRYIRDGKPSKLSDKNGNPVYSDKRLLLYRTWFENQAPSTRGRVINATAGGLNIKGMENIPLIKLNLKDTGKSFDKLQFTQKLHGLLDTFEVRPGDIRNAGNYLSGVETNLIRLKELGDRGAVLSRKMISAGKIGIENKIREELDGIDSLILSLRDESKLVSMVLQSPINDALNIPAGTKEEDVLKASFNLYRSIEQGAVFLLGLIKYAKKKLINLEQAVEH